MKIDRQINASGIRIVVKSTAAIPLSKTIISQAEESTLAALTVACLYKADGKLHSIHRGKIDLTALVVAAAAM